MEDVQEIDGHVEAEVRRLLATAFETAPGVHRQAGAELLRGVRRRTSRQRRARALVPAGAVAALGGAAAAAVTLTATVASAPSAFAAVTAAATKTSAESFRVTAETFQATRHGANGETFPAVTMKATGEFAPSHGLGRELVLDGLGEQLTPGHTAKYQLLFIGTDLYLHSTVPNFTRAAANPWVEGKVWPQAVSESAVSPQFDVMDPADPGALLSLLKSAGTVTDGPASGPGWTWHQVRVHRDNPQGLSDGGRHRLRGLARAGTPDADDLYVRDSQVDLYVRGPQRGTGDVQAGRDVQTRTAVSVTAPPASQVLRTNGYILLPAPFPLRAAKP